MQHKVATLVLFILFVTCPSCTSVHPASTASRVLCEIPGAGSVALNPAQASYSLQGTVMGIGAPPSAKAFWEGRPVCGLRFRAWLEGPAVAVSVSVLRPSSDLGACPSFSTEEGLLEAPFVQPLLRQGQSLSLTSVRSLGYRADLRITVAPGA